METLTGSRLICCLSLGWGLIIQGPRDALPIREHLERGKDRDFRFRPCSKFQQVNQLLLEETVPFNPIREENSSH